MFICPPGPMLMCGHLGVENASIHAALRTLSRGACIASLRPLSIYKVIRVPPLIVADLFRFPDRWRYHYSAFDTTQR